MVIQILGTGCPNCRTLESNTKKAVEELDSGIEVVKVEDITKILEFQVMRLPAMVINGKVAMYGKVPPVAEIREIIQKFM